MIPTDFSSNWIVVSVVITASVALSHRLITKFDMTEKLSLGIDNLLRDIASTQNDYIASLTAGSGQVQVNIPQPLLCEGNPTHQWTMDFPNKCPAMRKMFPDPDVVMKIKLMSWTTLVSVEHYQIWIVGGALIYFFFECLMQLSCSMHCTMFLERNNHCSRAQLNIKSQISHFLLRGKFKKRDQYTNRVVTESASINFR